MAEQKKKGGGGGFVKLFLLLILVAVGGGLAWGYTLDTDYHWEGSVVIDADTDEVHAWTGDLKKWDEWGPWRDEYPDMTYTYSESTTEVGDKMTFDTPDGKGSVKWTGVDPEKGVTYDFQWEEWDPMPGGVKYEATEDGKTKVTWYADKKDTPFIERYFMTLMGGNMETMFENGLAKLKTKVEADE